MIHFGEGNLISYNKAIRDNIPDIIKKSGNECNIKTLSDNDFLIELDKKLDEELKEYNQSKSVEELVDILEVIYRISELKGTSKEKLEKLRIKKAHDRGAFDENLFLIDTTKPENS